MGLVTVFCPLTMTGRGETEPQDAAAPRLVVDCSAYPEAVGDQVKTTLAPSGVMVSRGRGSVKLNTVP